MIITNSLLELLLLCCYSSSNEFTIIYKNTDSDLEHSTKLEFCVFSWHDAPICRNMMEWRWTRLNGIGVEEVQWIRTIRELNRNEWLIILIDCLAFHLLLLLFVLLHIIMIKSSEKQITFWLFPRPTSSCLKAPSAWWGSFAQIMDSAGSRRIRNIEIIILLLCHHQHLLNISYTHSFKHHVPNSHRP